MIAGEEVVSKMSTIPTPIEVFYSYADVDESLLNELEKHLSLLRREGLIIDWHKRHITPGIDWSQAIDYHLNVASIILLLISADFISSDYCYGKEMQRAMQRHETGEARVIPILLRPVDWQRASFRKLQALPRNGIPITRWDNRDEAFADVAIGIRQAVENLTPFPSNLSSSLSPTIWHIPSTRNLYFTGRESLLEQLHLKLMSRPVS